MIFVSHRLSKEEVNKIIESNGLVMLCEEYKNNSTKILCIDKEGYKVLPTIQCLNANKKPRPFDKNNPFTIENIQLFLSKNNPNIELLSNEYISSDTKLHCRCRVDNNEWYVIWENLKQGQGCPECKRRNFIQTNYNSLDEIKKRLNVINPNLFILEKEYKDCKAKMKIQCEKSHVFKRSWIDLLRNPRCPECSKLEYPGGYNFINAENNKAKWIKKNAIVYIVRLYNEEENFFKIGITNRNLQKRLRYQIPYNYEEIGQIFTNMYDAVYIEYELHYCHKEFMYLPYKKFYGWTECFNHLDMKLIKKYIDYYNSIDKNIFERHHLIILKHPYNLNILDIESLKKKNSYD